MSFVKVKFAKCFNLAISPNISLANISSCTVYNIYNYTRACVLRVLVRMQFINLCKGAGLQGYIINGHTRILCTLHGGPSAAAVLGRHRLNARPPPASARAARSRHVRSHSPSPSAPHSRALQSLPAPSSSSVSSPPTPPSLVAMSTKGTGTPAKKLRVPPAGVSSRDEQARGRPGRRKAI